MGTKWYICPNKLTHACTHARTHAHMENRRKRRKRMPELGGKVEKRRKRGKIMLYLRG